MEAGGLAEEEAAGAEVGSGEGWHGAMGWSLWWMGGDRKELGLVTERWKFGYGASAVLLRRGIGPIRVLGFGSMSSTLVTLSKDGFLRYVMTLCDSLQR